MLWKERNILNSEFLKQSLFIKGIVVLLLFYRHQFQIESTIDYFRLFGLDLVFALQKYEKLAQREKTYFYFE